MSHSLLFESRHPVFVAECANHRDAFRLADCNDTTVIDEIRQALDTYAVVFFRDQPLTYDEQIALAQQLGGELHQKTGSNAIQKNRLTHPALTDISTITESGDLAPRADRRRLYSLGNRLWHTDASFQDPAGRYSMLSAKVIPDVPADTEFADMRAAYDALSHSLKQTLRDERAHHSIAYSRRTLGFEFSQEEDDALPGAVHPLIRTSPTTGRQSLYLASHASTLIDWPVPEARLMLSDLKEHATQQQFVYRHRWQVNDFVIWDNRATMHRGLPFDDTTHRRELCRVTTLDT